MSQEVHTRRHLPAVLVGLLAAIGIVFAGAPAWAHDELIGSDPAVGAQVDALPAEITLTFSGVLLDEPGATDVVVTDAAGTDLTSGDPVIDGTRLTQQLGGSAVGEVTVIWRVVSSDGHPVSDRFTFSVSGGGTDTPEGTAPAPAPTDTGTSPVGTTPTDEGTSPALWIGAGTAIFAALVAVFISLSAAKRRRGEH